MTILVLGARGYLGANLVRRLRTSNAVVAVSRDPVPGAGVAPFARWAEAMHDARERGPVVVVNTIAIADHGACERDPALCDDVNDRLARTVATTCAAASVPLVHISTDGLFGQGTLAAAPAYRSVATPVVPINAYARSKAAAEAGLREIGWGHVVRLSFVGHDAGTGRGLVRFIADRARSGDRTIGGFVDNWFTPVHVDDVADVVLGLAAGDARGYSLRHVASAPAMTKFEYVRLVVERAELDLEVLAVRRQARPGSESTPVDQSLRCDVPIARERVIDRSARDVLELVT